MSENRPTVRQTSDETVGGWRTARTRNSGLKVARVVGRVAAALLLAAALAAPAAQATDTLTLNPDSACYDVGDTVTVAIDLSGGTGAPLLFITGGQFFLEFDDLLLNFVSADAVAPWGLQVTEVVGVDTIDYAVSIPPPFTIPGSNSGTMATLTFIAKAETCNTSAVVKFRPHAPPTSIGGGSHPTPPALALVDLGMVTIDSTPATISCPIGAKVQCPGGTTPGDTGMAAASDNCGTPAVSFADTPIPGSCKNDYTISRVWTANPKCGAPVSCTQLIDVNDLVDPSISCPANTKVSCTVDASDPANTGGSASGSDGCGGMVTISHSDSEVAGSCPQEKTITRVWTATDNCGNDATCTQTITVNDNGQPTLFPVPANVKISCTDCIDPNNPACPVGGKAGAFDDCDPNPTVTFTDIPSLSGCNGTGTISRTWKAEDACGNISLDKQLITVNDTVGPSITCPPGIKVDCAVDASMPANTGGSATATDNCGPATVTFADVVVGGACPQDQTITRTWTATDACLNSSACVQIIDVNDKIDPSITCPANVKVDCAVDATNPANTGGSATAADNCGAVTISHTDSSAAGTCPQDETITRTWTATDQCGNSSSCDQVIDVNDKLDPVMTCPSNAKAECDDPTASVPAPWSLRPELQPDNTAEISATGKLDNPSALHISSVCPLDSIDDFGIATWYPPAPLTFADITSLSADYKMLAGQFGGGAPAFYVRMDCGAPTAGGDGNVFVYWGTPPNWQDIPPLGVWLNTGDLLPLASWDGSQLAAFGGFYVGTHAAESAAGLATCSVLRISVVVDTCWFGGDDELFVDHVNVNGTVYEFGGDPAATDNCGAVSFTSVDTTTPGTCANEYTISRAWTATDDCGNTDTCKQLIAVNDTTPPVITCPPDATVEWGDPISNVPATANDNCGPATVTLVETSLPGACPVVFTLSRVYTATDACGNMSSCKQTITVTDTTGPVWKHLPGALNAKVECPNGPGSVPQPFDVNDNCDPNPVIACTPVITPGTCPQEFVMTRSCVAVDTCSNPSLPYIQVITVNDNTDPVLQIPRTTKVECSACIDPYDPLCAPIIPATATDACDPSVIPTYTDSMLPSGDVSRLWKAEDDCGNISLAKQLISFNDTTDPVIICPPDFKVEWITPFVAPAPPQQATATDNCDPMKDITYADGPLVDVPPGPPGSCPGIKEFIRTWTATDDDLNSDTCPQIITVSDTTPPDISLCPVNITVNADTGSGCGAIVTYTPPGATDNCGVPVVTCIPISGSTFPVGTTMVTCTATDVCGLTDSCTFDVTVLAFTDLNLTLTQEAGLADGLRCITLELSDPSMCPAVVSLDIEVSFLGDVFSGDVKIPCGDYTCITARDALHTLRRLGTLTDDGTRYSASFAEPLLGGNLNDNCFIDILDFTEFIMQYGLPLPYTGCSTMSPHSDLDGDGVVFTSDFIFIFANFLEPYPFFVNCCGDTCLLAASGGNGGPIDRISVEELVKQGHEDLVGADLNGDGSVDEQDVAAFLNGARP